MIFQPTNICRINNIKLNNYLIRFKNLTFLVQINKNQSLINLKLINQRKKCLLAQKIIEIIIIKFNRRIVNKLNFFFYLFE